MSTHTRPLLARRIGLSFGLAAVIAALGGLGLGAAEAGSWAYVALAVVLTSLCVGFGLMSPRQEVPDHEQQFVMHSAVAPATAIEELERLAALHSQGTLADDEFAAAKQKAIARA